MSGRISITVLLAVGATDDANGFSSRVSILPLALSTSISAHESSGRAGLAASGTGWVASGSKQDSKSLLKPPTMVDGDEGPALGRKMVKAFLSGVQRVVGLSLPLTCLNRQLSCIKKLEYTYYVPRVGFSTHSSLTAPPAPALSIPSFCRRRVVC